jgi:hypothetical protein
MILIPYGGRRFFNASYFEKCTEVFPYENLLGFNIMHNEKNHSIKHGGGDIAKYGDPINMSCDAPEDGHKFWVKEPGGNTNQGPEAALSMMQHSLRKEASALLCEGVQGICLNIAKFT